jgi:hypothetical protein
MSVQMLRGPNVVRIEWLPGSDILVGTCHCRAVHEAQDPNAMWEWVLAHPEGHLPGPGTVRSPAPPPARVAVPA